MADTAARTPGGEHMPRMGRAHGTACGAAVLDGLARRVERAGATPWPPRGRGATHGCRLCAATLRYR